MRRPSQLGKSELKRMADRADLTRKSSRATPRAFGLLGRHV
jgi:hypothetical protein